MDDKNPKISVVVPVYKVEPYLEKCVNSLLGQTYRNIEIILVDDGSPDNCPAMCDRFAAEHDNVTALHKPNGGLSDARNYGVAHARTDWIVFVDSDDYVEPIYVQTLVDLRNRFDAEMVITLTMRENEAGERTPHKPFDPFLTDKKDALYRVYSGSNIGWAAYGKLLQRWVLQKHPFPDGYYEDCACMYKIITEFDRIVIADYVNNYHYIQRDGSILFSKMNEKHLHIFDICEEFEAFIRENYPDMDLLPVLTYKRGVTQLLRLQNMPWKQYCEIFNRYKGMFRKNLKRILRDKVMPRKSKVYYLVLCTSPVVFKLQDTLLKKLR